MELKEIQNMKIGKYIALGAGIVGLLVAIAVVPATPIATGGLVVALAVAIVAS